MKISVLRKKYPRFFYRGYTYQYSEGDLHISFDFDIPPDISFHPKVLIKNIPRGAGEKIGEAVLNNLVFHLGLMEIPSYWKATCSPNIIIEAGYLNRKQIQWWKDLIFKGMGEYFYKNKIDFTQPHSAGAGFTKPNFLTITSTPREKLSSAKENLAELSFNQRALVPVGGGKDAIVTLELLKKGKQHIIPFLLNPKREQEEILRIAGLKNPVVVTRTIDPKLFKLNRKGYLNGHTPFSAYLAFLSVLCAVLFGYKYIALSNERSSNEGNVRYLGKTINHQYSKSFDFEKKFRSYVKTYLIKGVEYFSFLRPLYELQIAQIFANYPKYFGAFLSCNEANKTKSGTKKPTGKWCGKCAKCLFVWISLRPFVKEKQLLGIFKKNLFADQNLIPLLEELVGERRFKPFECVGTSKESLAAFSLSLQKTHSPLPVLLKHFRQHIAPKHKNLKEISKNILDPWNTKNFVPKSLDTVLRDAILKIGLGTEFRRADVLRHVSG